MKNHQLFFGTLAKKLNIKNPSDWYSVSTTMILQHGGSTVLGHYGGSLFRALSSIYRGA